MTIAATGAQGSTAASAYALAHRQAPAHAPAVPAPGPTEPTTDANHRSAFAGATVGIAMGAGVAKGMLLDRVRVLTSVGHNARSRPQLAKWATELVTGKITNDVVPTSGGVLKLGRRVLTTDGFGHSYRFSNGVGQAITLLNLSYAVPNLVDGYQNHGGWSGLIDSRSGRTGLFGLSANLSTIGLMGVAFARAPKEGGLMARMGAALGAEWLSSNRIVLANMVPGFFTTGNELGAFDWLNAGGDTSFGQSMLGIPGTVLEKAQQGVHAIGAAVASPFS